MDRVLETDRLYLRRFTQNDEELLALILQNPDAMRYYPHVMDDEETRNWLQRRLEGYQKYGTDFWAVHLKENDEFVGQCGLLMRENFHGRDELEVGYLFVPTYWGKGYATESARACCEYAFETLHRDRLIALVRPENMPSCRVAERLGMTIEGNIEYRGFCHHVYVLEKGLNS